MRILKNQGVKSRLHQLRRRIKNSLHLTEEELHGLRLDDVAEDLIARWEIYVSPPWNVDENTLCGRLVQVSENQRQLLQEVLHLRRFSENLHPWSPLFPCPS